MYIVIDGVQKEIYGILTKQEYRLFVEQRDMSLYECIKVKKSELESLLEKTGIDEYDFTPITREEDDLIIFPHEELYVLESLDMAAVTIHYSYRDIVKHISMFLKFSEEELDIMGEYFNIFEKVVNDSSWDVGINLSYQDDLDESFYGPFDSTVIFTEALQHFGLKKEK